MNFLINSVFNPIKAHPFIAAGLVIVLIVAFTFWRDRRAAAKYDKERAEYELISKQWATERAGLLVRAEESERREKEKEIEALAYKAAAEAGKKIDDATAQKIEEVAREAANAETNAEIVTDCRTRADRICALFRTGNSRFNCAVIYDECK